MNWKAKLTSRKWWAAVTMVIMSALVLFDVDSVTSERITALITNASMLVIYTLTEGSIDARAVKNKKEDE